MFSTGAILRELMLDDMLSNGYKDSYGNTFAPDAEYIAYKNSLPGAVAQATPKAAEGSMQFGDVQYQVRDNAKNRMSQEEIDDIVSIGRKSVNDFNADDIRKTERLARRYWKEMGTKSPFFRAWFGDWRAYDITPVKVATIAGAERGVVKNNDTSWDIQISRKVFTETKSHAHATNVEARPYLDYINDIVANAVLLDSYGIGEPKSANSLMMHSLYALADIGNGTELLKLYVEEMNDANKTTSAKRAYQLQNIERRQLSVTGSGKSLARSISTADVRNIADLVSIVKSTGELETIKKVNTTMLNPDGTPKVMYHGTPYGGYTVFKDWQYFTEDAEYAEGYQAPNASMLRSRHDAATNPMTYAVYLSVKKPFDTRDPKTRRIWQDEFYGSYSRTPLSDKGLPDWTDGIDLVEWIEENDYDYDAIILDEGGTGGYGDEVDSRGISVVVRNSTQIKSATDNIGTYDTNAPDIRHSMRDSDYVSDRGILANVLESAVLDDEERMRLTAYKQALDKLNEAQQEFDKQKDIIRGLIFKKGRTKEETHQRRDSPA